VLGIKFKTMQYTTAGESHGPQLTIIVTASTTISNADSTATAAAAA
jgi:chorismate synthase